MLNFLTFSGETILKYYTGLCDPCLCLLLPTDIDIFLNKALKAVPLQALGGSGSLRPRIFLTFGTMEVFPQKKNLKKYMDVRSGDLGGHLFTHTSVSHRTLVSARVSPVLTQTIAALLTDSAFWKANAQNTTKKRMSDDG
jgi:hypothetical protein